MTVHVTLAEAEGRLAELVARVQAGEEVLIDRDGAVVACLGPPPRPASAASKEQRLRQGLSIDHTRHPNGRGVLAHLESFLPPDLFVGSDPEVLRDFEQSRVFPADDA